VRAKRLLSQSSLDHLGLLFEVGIYEAALRREPERLPILEELGNAYARAGRLDLGLSIDRRICLIVPENPVAHYNLACTLSRMGATDEAALALRQALALGYHDRDHIACDPDLANLRASKQYGEILGK
jgi:Flp pilus assembly protein TadD